MKKITSLLTIGALSIGIQSASANLIFDGKFFIPGDAKGIGMGAVWDFAVSTDYYSGNPVQGWQTTHVGNYLEIWATFTPSFTHYAEMNAGEVSSLYQVVTAPSAAPFDIFFKHKGRNGSDTAGVSLFDLGTATSWPRGSGTLVYQSTYTSSPGSAFTSYSADNIFTPVSGRNYALVFDSISAAGGDPTVGNFLTDVRFGAGVFDVSANLLTPQSFTLSYASGGGGGTAAVPEPGQVAASLLLLGGIGGYVFLKRRKAAKPAVAPIAA